MDTSFKHKNYLVEIEHRVLNQINNPHNNTISKSK